MTRTTNGYKVTIENRITRLEDKVDSILNNHLPHIQKSLDEQAIAVEGIKIIMARWIGGGTVAIGIMEYLLRR